MNKVMNVFSNEFFSCIEIIQRDNLKAEDDNITATSADIIPQLLCYIYNG